MKRVCILTSGHKAGDVRVFQKEARALVRAGYDVTLVIPHEKNETIEGVKVSSVPIPAGRLIRLLITPWRIYRVARRYSVDVYHMHDPELMPVGLLLKKTKTAAVIYDIHEDLAGLVQNRSWLRVPRFLRKTLARFAIWFEAFHIRYFSAVVAADPEIGLRYQAWNPRIAVAQNFPMISEFDGNTPQAESGTDRKPGLVVNLGGISTNRSIREIVQAMHLVSGQVNARLILCGNNPEGALEEEIRQMPGWAQVDFRGRLRRFDALNLLKKASVALVLYSPVPNHYNVNSNRFYESLCAGIPVITSDFPRWREMVEGIGCGLVVNPTDPQAIADALIYLLTHPAEATGMGARGRQAVLEMYSWEQEQQKLLQLYDDILMQRT